MTVHFRRFTCIMCVMEDKALCTSNHGVLLRLKVFDDCDTQRILNDELDDVSIFYTCSTFDGRLP
ncbi:MAG TPA: hypothetical protein DCE42_21680 [Myxococcales bacterium]|nr:hypothetical protein [Deltaproteobacteria bacterium]HAA57391.1 hypothetical protein [Myxococcales bacterium]